jgi:Arc/MetJ-type ribon-helix-helix transcriptional regulator
MSVNPAVLVHKLVSLPHTMVEEIQDYRFQHRFKSEAETVRHLIERGMRRSEASPEPLPDDKAQSAPFQARSPGGNPMSKMPRRP